MKPFALLSIFVASFALAGCGGNVAESLGLGRNPPDAFAVVDRAPLSVPPDFSLRPPVPGAPRPQEIEMTRLAEDIVSGGAKTAAPSVGSDAEKALLVRVDAEKADPYIKDLVDWEAAQKPKESPHLLGRLLGASKTGAAEQTIDPQAERLRLHEEKQKTASGSSGP